MSTHFNNLFLLLFSIFLLGCEQSGRGIQGDNNQDFEEEVYPEGCHKVFCLELVENTGSIEMVLTVKQYTATSLIVEIESSGLFSNESFPLQVFMNAPQTTTIASFTKSGAWSLGYNYSYNDGKIGAQHDNSVIYQLPYAIGDSYTVSQGYDGSFSHEGENAIDFPLAEGTEIYAMRSGYVVAIEDRYSEAGVSEEFYDKANYVYILHNDDTLGKYVHLMQSGVAVDLGEHVDTGELIGYSGNTGYSTGPHLHLSISGLDEQNASVSFRTVFITPNSLIGEELQEGESYTAIEL